MDETFQAILDSLPPKPPRSKLEPYAELIHELRRRGRSYREIAAILGERCGVRVGIHTVHNFVRVRAAAPKKTRSAARPTSEKSASLITSSNISTGEPQTAAKKDDEVWQRIEALKQRPAAARPSAEKVFHYDENAPLTRVPETKQEG